MIVTEEEAKKLWCPEARTTVYIVQSGPLVQPKTMMNFNRPAQNVFCLGSKCMAWSWKGIEEVLDGYCGKFK